MSGFPRPTVTLRQQYPRGEAHAMDVQAFEEAIQTQGVLMTHQRAMGCPYGMTDVDDHVRRVHPQHEGCSSGFVYKEIGKVWALFTGNTGDSQTLDVGGFDGSNVNATLDRYYADEHSPRSRELFVSPFDRFFVADEAILWPNWERVQHQPNGIDRIRWPASRVEHCIDSRLEEYKLGIHFDVKGNKLSWRMNEGPGIDPDTGMGRVYTIWYLYRPYWYVRSLSHANRIVQTENEATGERYIARMPIGVSLVRERIFEDQQNEAVGDKPNERAEFGPADGSFGPR